MIRADRRISRPPTRREAMADIKTLLSAATKEGRRLLCGFDFPFGYPQGTARMLTGRDGWEAVWARIAKVISQARRMTKPPCRSSTIGVVHVRKLLAIPSRFRSLPCSTCRTSRARIPSGTGACSSTESGASTSGGSQSSPEPSERVPEGTGPAQGCGSCTETGNDPDGCQYLRPLPVCLLRGQALRSALTRP